MVAGEGAKCGSILALGGAHATDRPVELAELETRPGLRLSFARGGLDRELHRVDRLWDAAEQVEPVRDAGIGGEPGSKRCHRVEGLEGCGVTAELDESVAGDAVVEGGRRRDRVRLAAEHERLGEAMARECERAEAARGNEVAWREAKRRMKDLPRLGVVGRVTGLASPLLVGEAKQVERVNVVRRGTQRRLELRDDGLRAATGREAGRELARGDGRLSPRAALPLRRTSRRRRRRARARSR